MSLSDTVTDLADRLQPARERASRVAGGVLVEVPALLSRLLALVGAVLDMASERGRGMVGRLEERGRELASAVEPPRRVRRRRALRTAAWFAGGLAAGTAVGYSLANRRREELWEAELFEEPPAAATYGATGTTSLPGAEGAGGEWASQEQTPSPGSAEDAGGDAPADEAEAGEEEADRGADPGEAAGEGSGDGESTEETSEDSEDSEDATVS